MKPKRQSSQSNQKNTRISVRVADFRERIDAFLSAPEARRAENMDMSAVTRAALDEYLTKRGFPYGFVQTAKRGVRPTKRHTKRNRLPMTE